MKHSICIIILIVSSAPVFGQDIKSEIVQKDLVEQMFRKKKTHDMRLLQDFIRSLAEIDKKIEKIAFLSKVEDALYKIMFTGIGLILLLQLWSIDSQLKQLVSIHR